VVLALLDHRDESAERLTDADKGGIGDCSKVGEEFPLLNSFLCLEVAEMGHVGLYFESDEVAVGRAGAVATAEIVHGYEHQPALGEVFRFAIAGASWRQEIPVAPMI